MSKSGGDNTKRKFIEETYLMITEVGLENIKVRELSKRVGVSATALYKHFEDLNYLLVLASLKALDDYIGELNQINQKNLNPLEGEIEAWKIFNKHAFANPPIFLNLFWGKYNNKLEIALQEYFSLYPLENPSKTSALFCYPLYLSNIEERDYIWMRRAANEGLIQYSDAGYISRINCLIVRSMLTEHYHSYRDQVLTEKRAKECSELIEKTIRNRMIKESV